MSGNPPALLEDPPRLHPDVARLDLLSDGVIPVSGHDFGLAGHAEQIMSLQRLDRTTQSGRTVDASVSQHQHRWRRSKPVAATSVILVSDADINAFNALARASNTKAQSGDPQSILGVLEIIISYF